MATTIDTPRFSIEPFFIGPDERRLFGVMTRPPDGPAAGPGLLICYPIGDEYLLVHRTLAQLAIKLAGLGVSTLRFDYHGTGDSPGTGGVGSLDELAGDVAVAAREPRLRDRGRAFGILGARLGAALALRFAEPEAPADFMVLWDPVVRGRDYVEALRQAQQGSFLAPLLSQDPFEYGGFVYPRGLLDQLDGLDAVRLARRPAERVLLLTSRRVPRLDALRARLTELGAGVDVVHVDEEPLGTPPVARVNGRGISEIRKWMRRLH